MKVATIIQAVILMLIIAFAASCTVGKEYATRVFGKPKNAPSDSTAVAIRFLEMDSILIDPNAIAVTLPLDSGATAEVKPVVEKTEPEVLPAKKDVVRNKRTRN